MDKGCSSVQITVPSSALKNRSILSLSLHDQVNVVAMFRCDKSISFMFDFVSGSCAVIIHPVRKRTRAV